METILGKTCAMEGTYGDATPFTSNSVDISETLCDRLSKVGFERHGWEQMYNGFTGEPIEAKIFIGPTYYQRLKHMVSDKIHCLTMDHEVLTNQGWKYYNELTMDHKIATLKDGKLVYEHPIKLLYFPDFSGELYTIKSSMVDLTVTMNHKMYVSLYDKPFELVKVSNMLHCNQVRYHNMDGVIEVENREENIKDSKEPVFCLQVPSEIFYVRRNGVGVWTGNSRANGHVTTLTRQPLKFRAVKGDCLIIIRVNNYLLVIYLRWQDISQ